MKYEWKKYIDEMRRDGYAVAVIAPEALKGSSRTIVEEQMMECAYEIIDADEEYDGIGC